MENIKTLLGGAYHESITLEEVNTALEGKKLVDLATGDYVSKGKYATLEEKYNALQKSHTDLQESTKDYESLKIEVTNYRTEKADSELKGKLSKGGIDEKFFKYVKSDIESGLLKLGDDEKENEKAIATYLQANSQFGKTQQDQENNPRKVVGTGIKSDGEKKTNANEKVTSALRDLLGIKETNNQ